MRPFVLTLLAALFALAALFSWRSELADIEIRYVPHQTQGGRIFPWHALGQGFVCRFDGLHAIDVALVPVGGEATALEFVLRAAEPGGAVLRSVKLEGAELPTSDGWARFEFEPIEDSGGRAFFFELSSATASSHSPWIRYRGVPYLVRPWGPYVREGPVIEGRFDTGRPELLHPNLRAIALGVDGLDAAAAPAFVTLSDPATGEVLRRGQVRPRAPHAAGWAFFEFEALEASRWRGLAWRFDLPPEARVVGSEPGPAMVLFHQGRLADPSVLGATWRGQPLGDRDLVFRAWSETGTGPLLERLAARGGRRVGLAALAWFLAVLYLFRSLRRPIERGV